MPIIDTHDIERLRVEILDELRTCTDAERAAVLVAALLRLNGATL